MNNHKQLLPVSNENIRAAILSISDMVVARNLSWPLIEVKDFDIPEVPTFTSKHQRKKFQRRMNAVIKHATMRTSNTFLNSLGCKPVDYTEKEKLIRLACKTYRELYKKCEEARVDYLRKKGDFYGGKIRVCEFVVERTDAGYSAHSAAPALPRPLQGPRWRSSSTTLKRQRPSPPAVR